MVQYNFCTLWWTNIAMENHHFYWGKPLFLWSFSIAMLVHQRVDIMDVRMICNVPGSSWSVCFFLSVFFLCVDSQTMIYNGMMNTNTSYNMCIYFSKPLYGICVYMIEVSITSFDVSQTMVWSWREKHVLQNFGLLGPTKLLLLSLRIETQMYVALCLYDCNTIIGCE